MENLITDSGVNEETKLQEIIDTQNSEQNKIIKMQNSIRNSDNFKDERQENKVFFTNDNIDSEEFIDIIENFNGQRKSSNHKHHLKSKHHQKSISKVSKTRRSQVFPDLFLDSQLHTSKHKPNKIKIVIRAQQFIHNMLRLITKDLWNAFQIRKYFFNQIGDKTAFFNSSFSIINQKGGKNSKKSITNNEQKQIRGSPNFIQKQSIRIVHKKSNLNSIKFQDFIKNCIEKIPLISQQSLSIRVWDFIHLFCLIYYFTAIPILISFNKSMDELVLSSVYNKILLGILGLDIIWNFNITYTSQGKEITQRKEIVLNYLKNGKQIF